VTDALRRRLQQATAGLQCVQQILESGKTDDVEPAVFKILNELRAIEDEVSPTHIRTLFSTKLGQTCRALVVDDDANETELLAGFLRLSGFEVNTAMDGLQAMVQLSKHERPDVVLLDMNMPRFDGGKTVSAIRQNPTYKSLRIFAVSGANQEDTKVSIGPRGVNRWFTKPVNPQSLVEAIHHELAHDCAAV
jgi:CheY-like chemotaxis protein